MGQRKKMAIADRAKQFMPFAAVTGLTSALASKERESRKVAKAEISDEVMQDIDRKIRALQINDIVVARYYRKGGYLTAAGPVKNIDAESKTICIGETEIHMDELADISSETDLQEKR